MVEPSTPVVGSRLDRSGYVLDVEDRFDSGALDERLWWPFYLPHWSSRRQAAARYKLGDGVLRLQIEAGQAPWNPEFDGALRVSSIQTGERAGPLGSPDGLHRYRPDLVVREAQRTRALYTPLTGLFEIRLRAPAHPANMVSLWMIGIEDVPSHSAEICVCEIFGRDIGARETVVGMGLHPFGDPTIEDEFGRVPLHIDASEPHDYAALWTPDYVAFAVDEQVVKVVPQSPGYPMQLMLGIYEFADGPGPLPSTAEYPKELVVEWFRGWRAVST